MRITRRQLRDLLRETISETRMDKPPMEEVFSAGVLIIDGDDVLVLRAYRNWGFPKGHTERDEGPVDTAIRETEEETTLVVGEDYTLTGDVAPSITYKTNKRDNVTGKSRTVLKTVTYFLATRTSDKEPFLPVSDELGRPENDEWRWIPISDLGNTDREAGIVFAPRLAPVVNYLMALAGSGDAEPSAVP